MFVEVVHAAVDIDACCQYADQQGHPLVDVIRHQYLQNTQQNTGEKMDTELLESKIDDVANELQKDLANYPKFD